MRWIGFHARGSKLACDVCSRTGWAGGRWMDRCRAPHVFRCVCGAAYPSLSALSGHLLPRRRPGDNAPHRSAS